MRSRREQTWKKSENRSGEQFKSLQPSDGQLRVAVLVQPAQQPLTLVREIGDRRGEGNRLANLGVLAKEQGDLACARALWEQARLPLFGLAVWLLRLSLNLMKRREAT